MPYRNKKKFSINEMFSINSTGRSTDPRKPFARQTADELLWLINEHLIELNPHNLLEIGIASGGTSLILSKIFSNSTVYGLDLSDALIPKTLRKQQNFKMVIGNSIERGTIEKLKSLCEEFDFILFDGDHSEQGIKADIKNYIPLLRKGGLAVFHDIRHEPPAGIKTIYYSKIKPQFPSSFEYFKNDNNNGYGLWYKE